MKRILVIDDDTYICNLLVNYLDQNGYKAEYTISGIKGLKRIEKDDFDLVLCDFRLPDTDGLEILQKIKTLKPNVPVIIMTAYAEVKMAVKLIKSGAFEYVLKPIQPEEILQLISRATKNNLEKVTKNSFGDEFIVGKSKGIHEVMEHVKVVAPTDLTVLIEGETGSGKEYVAKAIHFASKRKNKPFVAVDCGAIPKDLANSELFGHIKGAFTGAINDKIGFFEQAKGGTLFLDEIGNLPYENQVKLLRALQERVISRVGDNKDIKVDIRLLAATNEDLIKQLENNEFREDLYHRINGFKIKLPALREREDDIFEFTEFFINKANQSFQKSVEGIDEEVKSLFLKYKWYGNIRELQNIINRAVLLTKGKLIKTDVLPEEFKQLSHKQVADIAKKLDGMHDLKEATEITEKEMIANALIKANYNKSKAAKMLNVDRKTLYNKIKLYELEMVK
ncbi:MAG TPA: sigma-54-dependent Fis family transcriptional regulator [Bacteroidales bacterium]|nr:sigma-54-dependent Fis family transcriptional regulator [Bacteroidales bacterium]